MFLLLFVLFIFLSLFLFRNKLKNTIFLYTILSILFIIYSYLFIDIDWKDSREVSLMWLKLLPWFILGTISIMISFIIDLFNKNKFTLAEKKYSDINKVCYIFILLIFIYFIISILYYK